MTVLDNRSLAYLLELMQVTSGAENPREAVEKFLLKVREQLVFDNVAVYLQDRAGQSLEVVYARAVGRAKHAEADANWGEGFAGQVIARGKLLLQDPLPDAPPDDRLHQAYLLGLPLHADEAVRGALIFVRFGGPVYEPDHIAMASVAAELLSVTFERSLWHEMRGELRDLKRQMQLQEDFVSTISHELRTPLGFIKGYSTSLLRQDTSWDEETQREFLTIIDEEADRLAHLIENVLESARLQSKTLPLRFQPLRLDAVIRDVTQRIRSHYKDLEVIMDVQGTVSINGDGVRLAQVFENLFTNALKYAPGAPIQIAVKQSEKKLLVLFTDRGPGIPQESLPLIFERFYRVRNNEKTVTGTGLGLYICRQIIEAHRGKIWAESTLGQGTTFFIELPIKTTA